MRYLQDEQHYNDLYDRHTIEECLKLYFDLKDGIQAKRHELKDMSDGGFKKDVHKAVSYAVNVIKIERYRRKKETITQWVERDQKTQEKYDNANPPDEVYCKECFSRTRVTSKDLLGSTDDRVLFMFACIKCNKRQALYEDGIEWQYEPPQCPKCNASLKVEYNDNKEISITKYACLQCYYSKTDTYDFKKAREDQLKKADRDKKLLTEYRSEFCYDDKVGPEAVMSLDNMIRLSKEISEQKKKENDPIYQKAKQLKILKVGQLKELLEVTLEKEAYKDLAFAKPDIAQYVIIDFSVNDMDGNRKEYDSVNKLKKLLKTLLEDTNWRLMTDGIHYRLGVLTGRLKAYEQEEDLMQLVK